MIVALFVLATILAMGIPAAIIFIPLAVITRNAGPLYAVSCLIARTALRVAGIRVEVEGWENIPAGRACIFMANHVSNLDAPALMSLLPGRSSAVAKRAVFKIPVFGFAIRLGDFVPTDRDGSVESARASAAHAAYALGKGLHITTFVEGKRSLDGRMLPFKKGPFYLAIETGAPCVPVSIYGTEALMTQGSFGIRPGTAHIVFHAPLDPAGYATREEMMEAMRAAIASGLPEWMRT